MLKVDRHKRLTPRARQRFDRDKRRERSQLGARTLVFILDALVTFTRLGLARAVNKHGLVAANCCVERAKLVVSATFALDRAHPPGFDTMTFDTSLSVRLHKVKSFNIFVWEKCQPFFSIKSNRKLMQ